MDFVVKLKCDFNFKLDTITLWVHQSVLGGTRISFNVIYQCEYFANHYYSVQKLA